MIKHLEFTADKECVKPKIVAPSNRANIYMAKNIAFVCCLHVCLFAFDDYFGGGGGWLASKQPRPFTLCSAKSLTEQILLLCSKQNSWKH